MLHCNCFCGQYSSHSGDTMLHTPEHLKIVLHSHMGTLAAVLSGSLGGLVRVLYSLTHAHTSSVVVPEAM
jgi:hypothetical protein